MRRINDEWIISVIQETGPVPAQHFRELLGLTREEGTYQYIKRHLKSLATYGIIERMAVHGVYYYRIPGDTRQIIEYARHDMTARLNAEIEQAPPGTRLTSKELADKYNIPIVTVRRALRLNNQLSVQDTGKGKTYVKGAQ